MKIIIKEPNKKPVLKDVEDMQTEDIKFNFYTKTQPIYGTAIFIGYDGNEDNIGLNKSQINYIKKNFK